MTTPFTRPRTVVDAELRLFVFHHAGGSAAGLFPLARALPQDWEPLLYDLPGHGRRNSEPPLTDMASMARRAVAELEPEIDGPFALFGHSLGAVLAHEVARTLTARGHRPLWLGVSGRVAPDHQSQGVHGVHRLDDDALLAALDTVGGGMPKRIAQVPEFRHRFLRLVRADLGAVASHRPDPGRAPLACPVSAYAGDRDPWAPVGDVAAWADETSTAFTHRTLPGGHFYFADHGPDRLARALAADVRAALPAPVGRT
ncbi:thioesterase II family protein [Nocardiopsis lucentensis]|uniref:thioesterase II family protein n=1 Tax=Nocardiopsis lucentensis TaxID=53441 RepID=UPI0003449AF6|nr:alpha/beta fold hydrolase [Nocardiopsis lucentensis]